MYILNISIAFDDNLYRISMTDEFIASMEQMGFSIQRILSEIKDYEIPSKWNFGEENLIITAEYGVCLLPTTNEIKLLRLISSSNIF